MQVSAINFSQFRPMATDEVQDRIHQARRALGDKVVLLAHHYQRADVYRHADYTGDSLKLSRLSATTDAQYTVFCGVHFMAEVADILRQNQAQKVILPDLAAGCSMADMASLIKVEKCWAELNQVLDADSTITPITYINSAADLKAFCAEHGGTVCTSSNAQKVLQWAYQHRPKVLFFPDQHLGRWSARMLKIPPQKMAVWDFNQPLGGLTPDAIHAADIILWKGFCSVHQMFRPQHIHDWRQQHPEGFVISHPECCEEVCELSDYVGSTDTIIKTIDAAPANTQWLVGTELNLVSRLAEHYKPLGKTIKFMSPMVCMCSTMARIDPPHLAWALESLLADQVVNHIQVPSAIAQQAKIALDRMLSL